MGKIKEEVGDIFASPRDSILIRMLSPLLQ